MFVCSGDLHLQYRVGNEVVVELAGNDRLAIGEAGGEARSNDVSTTVKSWTSRISDKRTATPTSSETHGPGGSAICTELHRQGYLSDAWFAADVAYANRYIDDTTRASYLAWAKPLVRQMQRSSSLTQLVRPFGMAWAQHMAYRMGATRQDNLFGRLINDLGVPLHRFLGRHGLRVDDPEPLPVVAYDSGS